jgi:methyl-accepting chemotaxis protein
VGKLRLELTHKFAIAFVLAIGVALALPPVLDSLGVAPWASLFVALGVGAAFGWLVSKRITRNVRNLRECTDRISSGDLTAEVELEGWAYLTDETVDLARSVHGMLFSLRDLVQHVHAAAEQVAQAARELLNSAEHVNATNQEISGTMDLMTRAAARQQGDIGRTSDRIRETADHIASNARQAREAFGFSAEARERAESGVEVSRRAIDKMQSLFEHAEQAGDLVVHFDEKIRSVSRITEVITSIAEKTHLLSLNASIEASHAGDAGRGFSVVAEEIRKLAENTADSAEQISDLIAQVEQESRRASEAMHLVGQGATEGRANLDGIFASLEGIRDGVQEAAHRAEIIFHKADGQASKAERMVQDVDAIARVADENSGATDDMRGSLAVQVDAMERMVKQAARLSETSDRLEELARRFRLR